MIKEDNTLKTHSKKNDLEKTFLFDVGITNAKEQDILEYIIKNIKNSPEKYYIVTPNPEIVVYARRHESFKNILNRANIALCDGAGLLLASRVLGKEIKGRITGADFMEKLCKEPITVGFLGAGPEIAEKTADCLQKKYPGLKVAFTGQEPDKLPKLLKEPKLLIDILFVAFGFPKQEEWISKNLDKIPVKVAVGVGGAFDYISGGVSRAPVWIRKIGFEWLYRLIRQPWRIKRQLALLEFVYLVIKERLK